MKNSQTIVKKKTTEYESFNEEKIKKCNLKSTFSILEMV